MKLFLSLFIPDRLSVMESVELRVNLRKLALSIECSLSNDVNLVMETFQLRMLAISTLG